MPPELHGSWKPKPSKLKTVWTPRSYAIYRKPAFSHFAVAFPGNYVGGTLEKALIRDIAI